MILSFSGDPFLASRGARRALRARGFGPEEVTEITEGMTAERVLQQVSQGGLFGRSALFLDFDVAFQGQSGVKPRNEVVKALWEVPEESVVVVLDLGATNARQKIYRKLGEHQHLPTPRFDALTHWVRQELSAVGVRFQTEVPETLADLFGEDLPSIAAEVTKLAVLEEEYSGERVRQIVNRLATRDAFDLIEATAAGDAGRALAICRHLMAQGEAPARVMGALNWQYHLVTRCVALQESQVKVDVGTVIQTLRVRPFVAKKAMAIARKLDEPRLGEVLDALVKAELAIKTGKDGGWAIESLTLTLARIFQNRVMSNG
ncbi:MAG: DNA polymerase III subunit delta [Trueperaceae bacterium]|nr:MAG: DNA polymerase III subunit delta [Trueperaceae bacterium]